MDGSLNSDRKSFIIQFAAGRQLFGANAAGSPFHVYAPGKARAAGKNSAQFDTGRTWAYAVSAGDRITDQWSLGDFENSAYHLRVHGPNGFYREFRGGADDPALEVKLDYATSNSALRLVNRECQRPLTVLVEDLAYGGAAREIKLGAAGTKDASASVTLEFGKSFGWYDLRLRVENFSRFEQRYAGHVETGKESFSDPAMGRVAS